MTCDQNEILWIQLSQLSSDQEEADTKVFLATQFAENLGCSDITIFTVDSDIPILAAFYVRKVNCRLMVHIETCGNQKVVGWCIRKPSSSAYYFRLRFCKCY